MPSNRLILCRPLRLPPSIFPSIRVFSNESALCIRWPKYWSFSFSIHPSNEYSGLISFGIGWSDLLAVQGTLKSLLQHHSSKSSILRLSAFFRGGCRNWLLNGRHPLSMLNSLGAYLLGGWNTMAWWRQHLWFLIWLAIFCLQAEESWNGWKDLQAWTDSFHLELVWAILSWFNLVGPHSVQIHQAEVSLGRFRQIFAIWADVGWFEPAVHPSHWQKTFKVRTFGEGYNLATSTCQSKLAIVIKLKLQTLLGPAAPLLESVSQKWECKHRRAYAQNIFVGSIFWW